jgi:hypothetical protein
MRLLFDVLKLWIKYMLIMYAVFELIVADNLIDIMYWVFNCCDWFYAKITLWYDKIVSDLFWRIRKVSGDKLRVCCDIICINLTIKRTGIVLLHWLQYRQGVLLCVPLKQAFSEKEWRNRKIHELSSKKIYFCAHFNMFCNILCDFVKIF